MHLLNINNIYECCIGTLLSGGSSWLAGFPLLPINVKLANVWPPLCPASPRRTSPLKGRILRLQCSLADFLCFDSCDNTSKNNCSVQSRKLVKTFNKCIHNDCQVKLKTLYSYLSKVLYCYLPIALELIISSNNDILAYRYNHPQDIVHLVEDDGKLRFTKEADILSPNDKLRLRMLCREYSIN